MKENELHWESHKRSHRGNESCAGVGSGLAKSCDFE